MLNDIQFLYVFNLLYYYGLMLGQVWVETSRRSINIFIKVCWL